MASPTTSAPLTGVSDCWGLPAAGDPPGPIVALVRSMATADARSYRRALLKTAVPCGVLVAANAAVGISPLSRTARAVVSAPLVLGAFGFGLAAALAVLGRRGPIFPPAFRRIALVCAALLALIIVSGAAVRLTGSGLGCPDWPTCANGSILPASTRAAHVEFANRVVTGLLILVAGVGVLAAVVRVPYRRDLLRLGLIVCALIFGNAIVGGAVVLFHLKTGIVMAHFLLSIASLSVGIVLALRADEPGRGGDLWGRDRRPIAGGAFAVPARIATGLLLVGVALGTVATGSGPHSGDPAKTERLPFGIRDAARVHSAAMWCALASVAVLAYVATRANGDGVAVVRRRVGWLLGAILVQGGVGYLQYARQLPAGLVEVHVAGATTVWVLLMWVRGTLTTPAA